MEGIQLALTVVFIVVILLLIIVAAGVRIVKQTDKYIIERLGQFHKAWGVGIHILIPFVDRVERIVSLKEQVKDFPPQPVITKDNVTMQIDTIVFYQVTDPKLFVYGVDRPVAAIEYLTATTLRNIIGDLDLDQTLTSRDLINTQMRLSLDEATDPWGIKVNRVELKNIVPPKDIRDAMERQMRAERERREKILLAEGSKQSSILIAEGEKQSAILRAEAKKEQTVREAEGTAEAILTINRATANGIMLIKEAGADKTVIALKSLETLEKVADGQATKIIIPSEIQNIAGLLAGLTEVIAKDPVKKTIEKK